MKAVLLISHGSRSSQTITEIESLTKSLKEKSGVSIFEYAFLELAPPNIPDGITKCVEQGATEVTVLLNFLNSGRHVDQDIPAIVNEARKKYPDVKITITRPVGQHEKIADLFIDLIN